MVKKVYCTFTFLFIVFFIDFTLYHIFQSIGLQTYWVIIPIVTYLISDFYKKFIRKVTDDTVWVEVSNLGALIIFYVCIRFENLYRLIWKEYSYFSWVTCIALFTNLIIVHDIAKKKIAEKNNQNGNYLFNLFYLNTSKAHEIAMLIDNKIMKTIEREQTSEELVKRSISGIYGKKGITSNEIEYLIEDSSKKRVYENFDVKMTKSIMLRKIYEAALHNKNKKPAEGDLVLFENIELQQRNVDDTVMILNVLQDSKIKNQDNDDLEINLNKMMEKMLDDFTIDYIFSYKRNEGKENKYIIQLPYKLSENFENGYHHNDLQLGKLSLVGIYRGKINFSERDNISSRFLELMEISSNENHSTKIKDGDMKLSYVANTENGIEFKFRHQKLQGELMLIDVIAIIQEINIENATENVKNAICI